MKKVLVTGMGIGKELGVCDACNMNFSWLVSNPSTVLWADRICIPKNQFELHRKHPHEKIGVAISIVLNELYDQKLLELVEIPNASTDIGKMIDCQVEADFKDMMRFFPEAVKILDKEKNDHHNIQIGDREYCLPYINSIYASRYLADTLHASCLFSESDYEFLKFKEGIAYQKAPERQYIGVLSELFAGMLPQASVLPEYALTRPEKCDTCAKHVDCQKTYEEDARKAICSYLKWREYDELYELRNEIDKILLEQVLIGKDISLKEAKRALEERQRKINTNIQRRFPKIKRWTKLATILSTPATIVAAAGGNIPAAIVSASMTGAAQVTEKMLELYESKSKWVGFINKMSK